MKKNAAFLPALTALLLLAGCVGPRRAAPVQTAWLVEAALPDAPAGAPAVLLDVRPCSAAPACERTALATRRADGSLFFDYYNHFVAPPARHVTHQARLYFGKTGLARVPLPGGPAAAPFRLESQLLAFHIEPAAAPAPAAAVVSIHIRLLGADNRVLLDETVPSRAPVASNTPAGRVAALAAALTGNLARQAALLRPALAR